MTSAPTVTVLGATGFIGAQLVQRFSRQGVVCWAPEKGDPSIYQRPLGHVVYAIGLTADFRVRPFETIEAHVCLLKRLLEVGHFESLTYLSSTRVYAASSLTTEASSLLVNPGDPSDLYNISKLMGESLCLQSGHDTVKVVRLSNVIGLNSAPDSFVSQLLVEGMATGKVLLKTSHDSGRDYLWIEDAVSAISKIAVSAERGIYNVASGELVTNRQVAEHLVATFGFEVSVAPAAPRWRFEVIDISKIQKRFAFSPQRFSDYFPEYLRNYRALNQSGSVNRN